MSVDRVAGLRAALTAAPDNHALRLMLAEELVSDGQPGEALVEYDLLLAAGQLDEQALVAGGRAALAAGRHDRAQAFVDAAGATGAVNGISELKREINEALGLQHLVQVVKQGVGEDASSCC